MAEKSCSDEEFIQLFRELGANQTAKALGITVRCVYTRRENLENQIDSVILTPTKDRGGERNFCGSYPMRLPIKIQSGIALIGSDAHYWPGEPTTAHKAFVKFCKDLQPKLVCLNGDVKDGSGISRHAPLGWERKPNVREEIDAVELRTGEIADAAKGSKLLWTLGNHDMRFDAKLAQTSPEYRGTKGFALVDHFPRWTFALSSWINDSVVVKHRFKGGIHATHNNALWSGRTMITGHLHSLKVTPLDDYNGTRWGIDSGTLADPYGEHADYAEDNPLNHRSGFIVMTFWKGQLLWPEIVRVIGDGLVDFRGQVIKV